MEIEKEVQAIEQATIVSRLMADQLQQHDKENKRLWCAVLALIAALMVMAGCMVYIAVNAQRMVDEAMFKALNAAGEVTVTTTEQTVEGDSATINNVDGEQNNYTSTSESEAE